MNLSGCQPKPANVQLRTAHTDEPRVNSLLMDSTDRAKLKQLILEIRREFVAQAGSSTQVTAAGRTIADDRQAPRRSQADQAADDPIRFVNEILVFRSHRRKRR